MGGWYAVAVKMESRVRERESETTFTVGKHYYTKRARI